MIRCNQLAAYDDTATFVARNGHASVDVYDTPDGLVAAKTLETSPREMLWQLNATAATHGVEFMTDVFDMCLVADVAWLVMDPPQFTLSQLRGKLPSLQEQLVAVEVCRVLLGASAVMRRLEIGELDVRPETVFVSFDDEFNPTVTLVAVRPDAGDPNAVMRDIAETVLWYLGVPVNDIGARVDFVNRVPLLDPVLARAIVDMFDPIGDPLTPELAVRLLRWPFPDVAGALAIVGGNSYNGPYEFGEDDLEYLLDMPATRVSNAERLQAIELTGRARTVLNDSSPELPDVAIEIAKVYHGSSETVTEPMVDLLAALGFRAYHPMLADVSPFIMFLGEPDTIFTRPVREWTL